MSHLSLAKKSGNAVNGFEKVREAITSEKNKVYILFHARDGSNKELNRMLFGFNSSIRLLNYLTQRSLVKFLIKVMLFIHVYVERGFAESLKLDLKKLEGIQN